MDLSPHDAVYPVTKIALVLDALAAEGIPKDDALKRLAPLQNFDLLAGDARVARSGHRLLRLRRRVLA